MSTRWQWYQSKVRNPNLNPDPAALGAEWLTIDGAAIATYTPQATDEGWYLLVTAEYTDEAGTGTDTAFGISANPVRADVSNEDNNSPDFTHNTTKRTVPESTAVGDPVGRPVVVDTNEDNDILTYELVAVITVPPEEGTADMAKFSIDKATGQIRVASKLSYEENVGAPTADEPLDDPFADGEYTVIVRATDPSGEGATNTGQDQDEITVTINATDVEEAPRVTGGARELSVNEADSSKKDSDVTKYVGLGYVIARTWEIRRHL